MTQMYLAAHVPPQRRDEPALWFAFRKAELAVCIADAAHALPCCRQLSDHGLEALRPQYLGLYGGQHCYAVEIAPETRLPDNWRFVGLREAFGALEPGLAALSGRAWQILEWEPFPHSLMVAFTAEYAGGALRPDGVEIAEARWFEADELPHLPPGISISRRLIDTITAELRGRAN